jgi:thiosulfate/3-mercaptopyruvate sulfurtransferase
MTDDAQLPIVVDPAWVAAHLDDPAIRLIEVGDDPVAYAGGHLPGAVFWDVSNTFLRVDFTTQDDPAAAAELFGAAGLTLATRVVCYGRHPAMASWGVWYLQLWGHQAAAVLDGGVAAWTAAGYPLSREEPASPPTDYPVRGPDPALRVDLPAVRAALGQPGTVLVDVRSPEEWRGEWFVEGPPGEGERGGHMPGAVYLHFREAVTPDGAFRPRDELRALYTNAGITPDREVIVYCMVGMRAAHTWFVL